MIEITKETMIGKLLKFGEEYTDEYLTGGRQRLQKLIGSHIFYKNEKNKNFYWNMEVINEMTIEQIQVLCDKIYLETKKILIKKRNALM